MILGSQFYSIRHMTQNETDIREAFRLTKEMGYHAVQISGISPDICPELLKELSEEYSLPIPCTHSPLNRILNDTDKLIAEHKIYGAFEIGLGGMFDPKYPRTLEGVRAFIADMKEPVKKILDAGLSFGYHNHAFEFDDLGGTDMYEILIEEAPSFNFILDTYWVTKGGHNPVDYINRLSGRILNLHFKDMDKTEDRAICACGDGIIDFVPIIAAAEKAGIRFGLVEQDNAPSMPDPLGEMAKSCKHLTPLVYHN